MRREERISSRRRRRRTSPLSLPHSWAMMRKIDNQQNAWPKFLWLINSRMCRCPFSRRSEEDVTDGKSTTTSSRRALEREKRHVVEERNDAREPQRSIDREDLFMLILVPLLLRAIFPAISLYSFRRSSSIDWTNASHQSLRSATLWLVSMKC